MKYLQPRISTRRFDVTNGLNKIACGQFGNGRDARCAYCRLARNQRAYRIEAIQGPHQPSLLDGCALTVQLRIDFSILGLTREDAVSFMSEFVVVRIALERLIKNFLRWNL